MVNKVTFVGFRGGDRPNVYFSCSFWQFSPYVLDTMTIKWFLYLGSGLSQQHRTIHVLCLD